MVAFDLVQPSAEQVELSSAEFKTFNMVADKLGIERVKMKKGINVRYSLTSDRMYLKDKEYQKVKISGRWYNDFEVFVDGNRLNNIVDVDMKFGSPHLVTVSMYADVEIDIEADVTKTPFVFIEGKKYELREV